MAKSIVLDIAHVRDLGSGEDYESYCGLQFIKRAIDDCHLIDAEDICIDYSKTLCRPCLQLCFSDYRDDFILSRGIMNSIREVWQNS